ncbi:outer membrane protein [Bartonella krasnovii]|uniref:outer membrane protein n=1 Tax=Bartonella krasnovii TaxID=2267275 RepID=UPI001F4CE5F7|nr:outer membrane protein [Bartonella krasnovii]UNF35695.1 porin family protein [Bartonella krasnovii]UNF39008.1 porin family protein [Bartonella krasnovii]UNF40740.1 porin family protein [Bartonella krasnovii]UNF45660.1 porin family protein [Bartonella krasnovii]UNF47247.1 porin family protein [Bartonella krasnovii]
MNIKFLMATSVVTLISVSAANAADVMIPHEVAPAVVTAPSFSWTGFYIGGQIGNFSSKTKVTIPGEDKELFKKDNTPSPSGFMGGIYAGSNVDLGNGLILGVETDAVWADREESKTARELTLTKKDATFFNDALKKAKVELTGQQKFIEDDQVTETHSYKEKWSGATRVRIGFAAVDRIMPYVAGGIAYAQVQGIQSVAGKGERAKVEQKADGGEELPEVNKQTIDLTGGTWADDTKTMVGFTIGGGVDFAMTDNVLLRAEYRYSDFGKKKFANDTREFNYKTNDFRVGVAYKF